jgi:formate dehydrogenase (coenzyme F420) beta subunit
MMQTVALETHKKGDLRETLKHLAGTVLALEEVAAILVPQKLPMKAMVMPVLVSDPDRLEGMDSLSPAFALNAAKVVSRLTRKPCGQKFAVILRPCEIRAFIELVKLKQGRREDLFIISHDCLGAYTNQDYMDFVQTWGDQSTDRFVQSAMEASGGTIDGISLATACQACEHPIPHGADLAVALFGLDMKHPLLMQALSPQGSELLDRLPFAKANWPEQREAVVQALIAERIAIRDRMMAETAEATDTLEKLTAYLAPCVNCFNCRVACPVCYCRECVFVTDVFDHDPIQYLGWAKRKGAIKMPTDTVFYHLTRMVHMSTACVGCGQCSNACPNSVPVMELFRTVAERTQAAFKYRAGEDVTQLPPLSEFREEEFEEIVGMG